MNIYYTKEQLDKIWVTSDWHFSHKNVAGPNCSNWDVGYRVFESPQEMDKEFFNQINNNVKEDDILFHLGDVTMGYLSPKQILYNINCKNIHQINGNHDRERDIKKAGFTTISDYVRLNVGKDLTFCMSHYPMIVWDKHHRGSYHLHGHCHGSLYRYGNNLYKRKVLDVGVDMAYELFGEWRPFKLTEIIDLLKNNPIKYIDHHNKTTND